MASSVRISAKDAKWVLTQLEGRFGYPEPESLAHLRSALKPKTRKSWATLKKAKAAKKKTKRQETAEIRAEVVKRAAGLCECGCRSPLGEGAGQMDHFFPKARARQSVATCWLLRWDCHMWKTGNAPTAEWWLEAFIRHATKHGYSAEAKKAQARLDSLRLMEEAEGVGCG